MKEESEFTKARPFEIPQNGPATTNAERIANTDTEAAARQNMRALRR